MKIKRFAALFLTLAMLLGISPLSVLASGGGGDDDGASPQISLISAFVEPDVIEIAIGDERTEAEIMDSFPDAVSATVNGTAGESVPVTEWSLVYAGTADGAFSTAAQAEFYYEPTLAGGYTLSGEVGYLPNQLVRVGEALLHAPMLMSAGTGDFSVTGDTGSYRYENNVLTITGSAPLEISMAPGVSSTTTDTIVVQSGTTANLTLNGVNIDVNTTTNACAFDIQGTATANITLQGINTLVSGVNKAGLQVETRNSQTATLTITTASTGSLTATGHNYGAGIGGGENGTGGNITISGGTVVAMGGLNAAGIGGGRSGGAGGNITISGGTVVAEGMNSGAGIGGGENGTGGTITISGGTVTATGSSGAGIGGGSGGEGGNITISGGTVTATGSSGAGIGGGENGTGGTFQTQASSATPGSALIIASSISDTSGKTGGASNPWSGLFFENNSTNGQVYGNPELSTDITIPTGKTLNVPTGTTLTIPSGRALVVARGATLIITESGGVANEGSIYNYGTISVDDRAKIVGDGTIYPQIDNENPTVYLSGTSVYLRLDSGETQISYALEGPWQTYTGRVTLTGATNTNTVTVLRGTHDVALKDVNIAAAPNTAFDIQNNSVVNLTLFGSNTMQSGSGNAGLQVSNNSTLNITSESSGSLSAEGGPGGAGIGGDGGNITISGGTVVAMGGSSATGIGGGKAGAGGTVKITGGRVTAAGGSNGAGIGGGTLEISGGTLTATGGGGAQALSAKPTYTLPTSSTNQFYSVSISAGAPLSSATSRALSEDYITGSNYVKIAMSTATPQIGITPNPVLTYNGTQQTQSVDATLGGATLTESTHYTLSGNTATNAGDYTLTVTVPPLGADGAYDTTAGTNYIGGGSATITASYTIQRAPLTITGATAQSRAYNGIVDATADVRFSGLLNGEILTKGTDYTVSADFPSPDVGDNLTVGGVVQLTNTAKASNYIFSNAEFSFPTTAGITPLALAGAQVALGTPLVANGTQQTQSVASITLNGRTLAEGTDYTLSGNTVTDAGSYTLTVTGKGNYSGTLAVPFTVVGTAEEALPLEPNGTLDLEDSLVPSGNTLHINPQSSVQQSQDLAKLREFAQQNGITGEVHFLADITMTDANGGEVQPQDGNTRLRIDVPGLTTADTVTVLHIKDDGSVEEITPVYVYNGYVEFFPTSFSVYSVIVHRAGAGTTTALSPQTGVYG